MEMRYEMERFLEFVFHPATFIALCFLLIAGFTYWVESSLDSEQKDFVERCVTAGETRAKCQVLSEIKRSSDSAGITASFAVGLAAGSAASRR